MQFIDLSAQQKRIRKKIESNITTVLDHGMYIMGPEIAELEQKLSQYSGTSHGIACASGTDALLLALMAYNIGPGDVVFTTPFTFIATAEVISLLGAVPVFVDIDPRTFNIDPRLLERAVEAVKTGDTSVYPLPVFPDNVPVVPKGIIPVDLFGLPADYDAINSLAQHHGLFVIEDAAQSFGARYKNKKACSLANIACSSFFPAKPLGCYGDGGMCFTDDDGLAEIMRSLRIHGKGTHKYDNVRIGINGRLDTMQAAILLAKFDIFHEEVDLRQEVASRYTEYLSSNQSLVIPHVPEEYTSVWAQYSILAQDGDHRTVLQNRLGDAGIPTAVYYPKPLHLQTAFSHLRYKKGDFPISEDAGSRIFSLPIHPYLKAEEQRNIARVVGSES